MSENIKFRSSLRGYNKKDVNAYILEMNQRMGKIESEARTFEDKLKARITELEAINTSLNDQLISIKAEPAAKNNCITTSEHNINKTNLSKTNEYNETAGTSQILSDGANLNTNENESTSSALKAEIYDKISSQVGNILINATKNAEDIIRQAEKKAKIIVESADNKAESDLSNLTKVTQSIIVDISENAKTNAEACIKAFSSYAEDVACSSKFLADELEKKYMDMQSKIECYKENLKESINESIKKIDSLSSVR